MNSKELDMILIQIQDRPKVSMVPTTISEDSERWQMTLFEAVNGDTYLKKSKHTSEGYLVKWFEVTGLETERSDDPKPD